MILKSFFKLFIFFICLPALSQPMSKRCELMHEERQQMIRLKSKAISLSQKAQGLVAKADPKRKSVYARMKLAQVQLNQKVYELNQNLKNKEETMIRKGCPGLKYRSSL